MNSLIEQYVLATGKVGHSRLQRLQDFYGPSTDCLFSKIDVRQCMPPLSSRAFEGHQRTRAMYDLMEAKTYNPKGNYKIDAYARCDGRKDELIAAWEAVETASRRKKVATWRSIILASAKEARSRRPVVSG